MLNNITRRDIVGDVLTLFDYVEELERENERLKREQNVQPRRTKDENKACIDDFNELLEMYAKEKKEALREAKEDE